MFGDVKLAKNDGLGKDSYSGYGAEFDSGSPFSFPVFDFGKNVVICAADNSSSIHIDNQKKDILVFGEGATQELDDSTITGEAKYSISSSRSQRKFYFLYNEKNSFLFVNT